MSAGAQLRELLERARRERLRVSVYRDEPDADFNVELYETSGFKLHEHGALDEILARALEQTPEQAVEAALPDALSLSAALEEIERLTRRSELAFSLVFAFPAGAAPYCRLEAFYHDGHLRHAAHVSGEDLAQTLADGLAALRNHEPQFAAEPRPRPSDLADEGLGR